MQRLAHQGEQNAWFTGNPYHSLFLPKEPSEEKYLQKSIQVPFNNPCPFGGTATTTLPEFGERITDITLRINLPQLEIPTSTAGWVYPTSDIVPPSIYVFRDDWTYNQYQANQTVQYYSTQNLQWFDNQNPDIQLTAGPENFIFTYLSSLAYIGFLQADASFFGFDYFNALFRISVQANEYIYVYAVVPQSPLTYEQSGWIQGYFPAPVPVIYCDSVGTFILRTARLLIGGQTIDTVTGEFIEIQDDVMIPYENQAGLTLLTGKNDTSSSRRARTYYVSLPFTQGFDIPIHDLYKQDVQVVLDFDTFFNITPNTSQFITDKLVYFNYITGDNISGIPGIPFNEVIPGFGVVTLALVIDSVAWDGQYVYMFTSVTVLEINQKIPYFIVFDLHKDIVTDNSASTLQIFPDFVQNESIATIGKNLYVVGLTGSIYSTVMRGPLPLTTLPSEIAKTPLVAQPLFTHNVAVEVPTQSDVSYTTIIFDDVTGVAPGLILPLSQTVIGLVADVTYTYVTIVFIPAGIEFVQIVAAPVADQTGATTLTIPFMDVTGVQLNQLVALSKTIFGAVVDITYNYVTIAFFGPTNTPALAPGTPLPFYKLVTVPNIPAGIPLGFYFPVSTYTLGTDGTNLYVTSTVNDSYAGSQYTNVFVYNTSSGATSNLVPAPFDVNFSTQPVFDGTNMWYVDKYQLPLVFKYNIASDVWTFYNYSSLLSIPQQNFSFSVFDGTYVYWFTDVTLTESLAVGGPVSAGTDYWIRYNTKTDTWQAYNWVTPVNGGFYDASMGLVNQYMMPTTDPAIKEALFDGQYIHLTSYLSSVRIQYDTTLDFTSNAAYSWNNYNTGAGNVSNFQIPNPYGYAMTVGPMVYDGRFLFHLPFTSGIISPTSNVSIPAFIIRYDTAPIVNPQLIDASLIVRYDKLPEKTKLPSEYYVMQTSLSQSSEDSVHIKSVSSGPVKEMFILNQELPVDPFDIYTAPKSGVKLPGIAITPYQYTTQTAPVRLFFNGESSLDYTTWIFEPMRYHTTMPQRNVSFLSFAFDPEGNMPSGTVNFSRIRDVNVTYPIVKVPKTNSYTRIYTRNYNVLRVRDGMGGLLFNSPEWYDMSSVNGRWNVEVVAQIYVG